MPAASSSAAEAPPPRAAIVGLAGPTPTEGERRLFRRLRPAGVILFARNCRTPAQVRALIGGLHALLGRPDLPVLIDQEGGRVARLRPPHWPARPAPAAIGRLAALDWAAGHEAAWLHARLIAVELAALGITVACAPVLDLALPGRTVAIGDRALGADPELVGSLGQAMIGGFLDGGVLPVIKHLPGHGRAAVDSHLELPRVDAPGELLAATDWRPFQICRAAPLAMTAHVLYPALDAERPATLSARVVAEVIRGAIGFAGALLSDDLAMGALSGSAGARAAAACAAGCDLALHCSGDLDETTEVLEAAGPLAGRTAARVAAALATRTEPEACDMAAGQTRLDRLLDAVQADAAVV